jgi:hypothetical protein
MLTKSVLSLAVLVSISAALLWAQGGGRRQQGFADCDLDIRPDSRAEVQIYWTTVPKGVQYQVWSTRDQAINLGYPDGSHEIYLSKGVPNTVTFEYDAASRKLTIKTCNSGDQAKCPTEGPTEIPVIGNYNEILLPVTPTEQRAEPGQSNKERLLITGGRFGLEFSFTLATPK